MTRHIQFAVLLIAISCTGLALAQTGSPSAFVYVSSSPSSNHFEVNAFTAASSGMLTPVSGSPFAANVQAMAVNAQYLFGTDGVSIYSFSIASDGALEKVSSINAQKFNGYNCGGPTSLFLDRSGATLYDEDYYGNICANNTYQSFHIDSSTGELKYLGASVPSVAFSLPLSFIGNNVYSYGSWSYDYSPWLFGFKRTSNGALAALKIHPPMPVSKQTDFYEAFGAAADSANHVAISVIPINQNTWQPDGPAQLAIYTATSTGSLTTKSTWWNMPPTAVQYVSDLKISPSGKLLAIAGAGGLQIFHFNGGNPITHYTPLLTKNEIDQLFWDQDHHLYAISRSAGKLFVFTVTPTGYSQAPGSPYKITNPQNIIVLPKS